MNALIFWSIVIASSSNLVDWNKHTIYFKLVKILYFICTQSSLSKLLTSWANLPRFYLKLCVISLEPLYLVKCSDFGKNVWHAFNLD